MTSLPVITLGQLVEAGVHFGHQAHRWNPRMAPYIYGQRNRIHIIDLRQTVPMFQRALHAVHDTVAGGGRILFVGSKRQAAGPVAAAASSCGQYYVNHRWLGGMLTNWRTVSNSIERFHRLVEQLENPPAGLTKKEILLLTRNRDQLERVFGGVKSMGGLPDMLLVLDVRREAIAVAEAKKLGIPIVAICDTNVDPSGIEYPVPGNDDALRAINLYCDSFAQAVLAGIGTGLAASGETIGDYAGPAAAAAGDGTADGEDPPEENAADTPAEENTEPATGREPAPEGATATDPAR